MMGAARYIVGIDLGTTNSATAYVEIGDTGRTVHSFAVEQLVREGATAERAALPSFLYIAGKHELGPNALHLPWDQSRNYAVGEFAREQGSRVPGHMVSSAKSWLCHGGVDREADILPYGGAEDVAKLSPVEASARYLQHLREAWDRKFADAPLAEQDVILTVPASFDEVARELTVAAAQRAGLDHIVLLEEPQAAFYAWLQHHEDSWQDELGDSRLAVVVDVGGGTTDFSLIGVTQEENRFGLVRHAVGEHILLGGDNIDVALARHLEPQLRTKLDSQRWHLLTSVCRGAKEQLLGEDPPESVAVRLVGRGGSVVGGTVSGSLKAEDVKKLVVDGFFPIVEESATPRKTARAGLQEWGLPFASDPEIPRHLAAFLLRHASDVPPGSDKPLGKPDAILFNGGALKPKIIRDRIETLLAHWTGRAPRVLFSEDLDLAVARGAAYYGLVRRGKGVRIGGGSPRAYYVGLAGPTAEEAEQRVLCIAHRGMHEGEELQVREPEFEVIANRGVSFPLFASSTRLGDTAGEILEAETDSLTALPPIRTVLRFGKKLEARKIPVSLATKLTEIGTLELWCRAKATDHRWRLQFQLRDQGEELSDGSDRSDGSKGGTADGVVSVVSEEQLAAAKGLVEQVFPSEGTSDGDPVALVRELEQVLGTGKDAWPIDAIRLLWDSVWAGQQARRTSGAHEARWLNLCGFLLRPGFGADTDDLRVQQLWRMRSQGIDHARDVQCRTEWWNLWKRIAGGLGKQQQMALYQEVAPALLPKLKAKAKDKPKAGPQEVREYWQLMASCEQLSAEIKRDLGDALLPLVKKGKASTLDLWVLGRLGARTPFHGPVNQVVAPDDASRWVERLLKGKWKEASAAVFPLTQIARVTGDRARDLPEELRERVAEFVRPLKTGERAARLVTEVVPLAAGERARILDESLPVGLQVKGD